MPGENIFDWSSTAANNDIADSLINWQEGQPRASVNDSARSMMAALAKERDLQNGSITTGGTANAQTFTSGMAFTAVPTGLLVLLKIGPGLTNTSTTTLNMDSIGAIGIKSQAGADLVGGELVAGAYAEFRYDGTNWILLRSSGSVIGRIVTQIFTASGTYTPTVGMTHCIIEAVGGGGGGGGSYGGTDLTLGGGGGGAGGYARKIATAIAVGASKAVTIGAGGAAGAFGSTTAGTGGTTSVGSLCVASGGTGGTNPYTGSNSPQAGAGGIGTVGDLKTRGGAGLVGAYLQTSAGLGAGGDGGDSLLGGGGQGLFAGLGVGAAGGAGGLYGGGGAGACTRSAPSVGANGGAGGPGVVFITEFVAL